jgi:hypothetical protein
LSERELFAHEVRKDGRPIVILRGVAKDGGAVTVETKVYPVGAKVDVEPRQRPFAFGSAEQATRFVDDVLDSLEYLNCQIVEPS